MSIPLSPQGPSGANKDNGGAQQPTPPGGKTGAPSSAGATQASGWAAWLLIGIAIMAVVILAAVSTLGGGNGSGNGGSGGAAGGVAGGAPGSGETVTKKIDVEGMAFVPNSLEVAPGTHLILEVTNGGDQTHDLKINGAETGRIKAGDTVTLDAGVFNETTVGWCTIAGHRAQGMELTVNVAGSATGGHDHAMAPAANPHVEVPDSAKRLQDPGEGFQAFDPKLNPAPTGTTHEYTWVATEEVREVAPGVEQAQWLFNGQAPGPTLRGKVGDKFKITLRNDGTMGHSVDFHAGEVSPDAPMATIDPGEEVVYEFTAKRSGIWMYHCATAPMSLHIANGMAGAVIIDPPSDSELELADVDAEYALVASEMFLGRKEEGADPNRVTNGQFDLMAFNYYPNQYDHRPIKAKVGDTIRIWVMNVGPDQPLSFHVVGEIFDTVFTEGGFIVKDGGGGGNAKGTTGAQVLPLLPAQGGYVEMTFDEPGTYTFVNHIMTNAEKGQHGKIVVTE